MDDTVRRKIEEGNDWYLADQRQSQLGTPGAKWSLEGRWRLFDKLIGLWFAGQAQEKNHLRVLDAGCGDGINMSVLKDIFARLGQQVEIIGSDYNTVRLERAVAHGFFNVLEADLRKTPFEDSQFDLILCSHVLEHIPEDVAVMRELGRILAPSGLLIIAVPNEGCAMGWLRNHIFHRSILRHTDHVNFYTVSTLVSRTVDAGFVQFGPLLSEGFYLFHEGIYTRMRETTLGRFLIEVLARIMPSQTSGLVMGFRKAE